MELMREDPLKQGDGLVLVGRFAGRGVGDRFVAGEEFAVWSRVLHEPGDAGLLQL